MENNTSFDNLMSHGQSSLDGYKILINKSKSSVQNMNGNFTSGTSLLSSMWFICCLVKCCVLLFFWNSVQLIKLKNKTKNIRIIKWYQTKIKSKNRRRPDLYLFRCRQGKWMESWTDYINKQHQPWSDSTMDGELFPLQLVTTLANVFSQAS